MANLLDNLKLADLVNTASDEILTEELITLQLVNEGTVEQDYPEEQQSLEWAIKRLALVGREINAYRKRGEGNTNWK
tara:strand:- start:265 stop:495 length:231 start_codon:yes stop_codon:yes gene_type:complete